MNLSEAQEDEIMALESIYGDHFSREPADETSVKIKVSVAVEVPSEFSVTMDGGTTCIPVEHLPPIGLFVKYTASTYPHIPTFALDCSWLTIDKLSALHRELTDSFDGEPVVFDWCTTLQSLDLSSQNPFQLDISLVNSPQSPSPNTKKPPVRQSALSIPKLLQSIIEFDAAEKQRIFDESYIECEICYSELAGHKCHRLSLCGHTYCRACLTASFTSALSSNQSRPQCPTGDCTFDVSPLDLKVLLSAAVYAQYEQRLLEKTLSAMDDVHYCPRPGCGKLVLVERDLGRCPCGFVFCLICNRVYHGVSPCSVEHAQKLLDEYQTASPARQEELERRYGLKKLLKMREEAETLAYIHEISQQCPHCKFAIQKTTGCNKMVCTSCRNHFCWLCLAKLTAADPYEHFRMGKSVCAGLLFDGMANPDWDDEEEEEEEYEGGLFD